MKFEIQHRFSGAVLFTAEAGSLKIAVELAIKEKADLHGAYLRGADLSGAYLSGAYLRGADLSGADLSGAYLSGADLSGAYLSGAYLSGAYLSGADLSGADLSGADLSGAYLRGADLSGADLSGAYLSGADLSGAYLSGAYLSGADLSGADLSGADLHGAYLHWAFLAGAVQGVDKHATPEESIVNLDKVREIILDNADRLNMGDWHEGKGWQERTCAEEAVCGTSHCLAGWLQVCATDKEVRAMPTHLAGIVSAPVAAKMFFRTAPEVLGWLKDRKYAEEAKDYV